MIIKINNDTEYDFVEAKRENGQIVGMLADGNEVILGGDIPDIDELFPKEPTTEQRVSDLEEQLVQADETAIALYESLQEQETINIQQDEALVDADETSIGLYESQQEQETINAQQDEALMEIYEMLG